MPFTNAPSNDTYSSHRLPIVQTIQAYAADPVPGRGAYVENLIPIVVPDIESKPAFVADNRLGTRMHSISTDPGSSPPIPLGVYVWEKAPGTVYYFHVEQVTGNTLKVWTSTDNTTWTNVLSYSWSDIATTKRVGFTEFIDATNVKSLIMVDGINGYVFTSNAAGTKIVDVDFPSPHMAFPVYLDGYVFLIKRNTGDIYNSDLNLPSSWTAGSFLSAELYPDDAKALVKINNYLLVVGQQSCEFFQDVGNFPASPLGKVDGAVLPFGTNLPESIAFTKDSCIMLANSVDGGLTLKYIEGFKYNDLTPPWLVSTYTYYSNSVVYGNFQRQYGQLLYSLSFTNPSNSSVNVCPTYSFENKTWFSLKNAEGSWWMMHSVVGPSTNPVTFFCGYSQTLGKTVVGNLSGVTTNTPVDFSDIIYVNGSSSTIDSSSNFTIVVQTPKLDFGTMNKKAMHRLGLRYNLATAQSVATNMNNYNQNINIYWTDYDVVLPKTVGASWPTQASLMLNTTTGNTPDNGGWGGDHPFVTQLGMFRQRTMSVVYGPSGGLAPYYPIRLNEIEFDINKGQQ